MDERKYFEDTTAVHRESAKRYQIDAILFYDYAKWYQCTSFDTMVPI